MKKFFTIFLVLMVSICSNAVCESKPISTETKSVSPIGIFNTNGEQLFSLGSTFADVENALGEAEGYVAPHLNFDADTIEIPKSTETEPEMPTIVAHENEINALVAAASETPLTAEEVDAILSPFGYATKDIGYITEDFVRENDVIHNRLDTDTLKQLEEILETRKETYRLSVEIYKMEQNAPYDQWIKDIQNSLEVTSGMLSLMVAEGSNGTYPGIALEYIPSSAMQASKEYLSLPKELLVGDMKQYLARLFEGQTFSSVEERNTALKNEFDRIINLTMNLSKQYGIVSSITLTTPNYLTANGEYVGMAISDEFLASTSYHGSGWYCRFYTGEGDRLVELSGDYISSLSSEERQNISPL